MRNRFLRIIGLSCVIVLLFSAIAFSAEVVRGPYVSGQMGMSILRNSDLTDGISVVTLEFSKGWALGAAAGYNFGMFRAEGEIGYQKNSIDKVSVGSASASASGDATSTSFLVNGYFDFVNSSSFTPYVSAGIGMAKIKANDFSIAGIAIGSEDDTVFAYQVGAGVGYSINKNMIIDLKYRYFATKDPEFGSIKANIGSHNIYLGFRYNF